MKVVTETNFSDMKLLGRGKVRDIYDLGEAYLIVTTDRVSAFDYILPNGIPNKGAVLTALSEFWFKNTSSIVKNHLITTHIDQMPLVCRKYADILEGRSMLVKKAKPFPVECVVRGYITGSGWNDYKKTGEVCGIKLPANMQESEKFAEPLFTPATKAEIGLHDENISFERMQTIVGAEHAAKLKEYSIALYQYASAYAAKKGIIIADTKFEFGLVDDKIILIDEALTPDSSRFWSADTYTLGKSQDSMDKQGIRDYLIGIGWDKQPPVPVLSDEIVAKTAQKYQDIKDILTK